MTDLNPDLWKSITQPQSRLYASYADMCSSSYDNSSISNLRKAGNNESMFYFLRQKVDSDAWIENASRYAILFGKSYEDLLWYVGKLEVQVKAERKIILQEMVLTASGSGLDEILAELATYPDEPVKRVVLPANVDWWMVSTIVLSVIVVLLLVV